MHLFIAVMTLTIALLMNRDTRAPDKGSKPAPQHTNYTPDWPHPFSISIVTPC